LATHIIMLVDGLPTSISRQQNQLAAIRSGLSLHFH